MDYRKAIERAVVYIEEHLSDPLRVEEVAEATGYSYYHLSRQFIALLGEGLGGYVKKRRLAEAAQHLLYSDRQVIDIALDSGFDSSEAFSRAFKSVYGVSPQTYRRNRLDVVLGSKMRLDTGLLDHLACNVTVHPKMIQLDEIKVAGLRGETTRRNNTLEDLWHRANAACPQIPHRIPGGRSFGICEACHDNTLYTMNDDVRFTEVAGIEVSSFEGLPEPFVSKVIPGGRYAVFTHRGTLRMLKHTFNYIWGTWSLTTREKLDGREDFEVYDQRYTGYDHPDSEMDIYIPVQ